MTRLITVAYDEVLPAISDCILGCFHVELRQPDLQAFFQAFVPLAWVLDGLGGMHLVGFVLDLFRKIQSHYLKSQRDKNIRR